MQGQTDESTHYRAVQANELQVSTDVQFYLLDEGRILPRPNFAGYVFCHDLAELVNQLAAGSQKVVVQGWEVVVPWVFIRSDKTFPVAGYVIPPDLPDETEVWVEDVAEEIFTVFWSQGTSERTVSSYATWRDGDLVFPPPPEQPYITG